MICISTDRINYEIMASEEKKSPKGKHDHEHMNLIFIQFQSWKNDRVILRKQKTDARSEEKKSEKNSSDYFTEFYCDSHFFLLLPQSIQHICKDNKNSINKMINMFTWHFCLFCMMFKINLIILIYPHCLSYYNQKKTRKNSSHTFTIDC